MNERIEYIFDQALEEFKAENKHVTIVAPVPLQRDFVEKFAKLIGIECLSIADSIRDECDKDGESQQALGAAWVGIAIARHFGVEE